MKLFFRIACLTLLLSVTRGDDMGFDLADALGDDPTPAPPKAAAPPKKDDDLLDLSDALGGGEDPFAPKDPVVDPPPRGGGGGTIKDSDLYDITNGGGGGYKPEGGHYKPDGGRAVDPGYNPNSGPDQPQEAGSGQMAGIVSAIGAALVGAASSYFAYKKKKLCFKLQGGQDPESGNQHMNQSDPQVMSNLLRS